MKAECVRGNLNTRLEKLSRGDKYDALMLAAAGVIRMGWEDKISENLGGIGSRIRSASGDLGGIGSRVGSTGGDTNNWLYCVGQGALAVQCRSNDGRSIAMLHELCHRDTLVAVVAERALLSSLEGGCATPVGVSCEVRGDQVVLQAGLWSLDGKDSLFAKNTSRWVIDDSGSSVTVTTTITDESGDSDGSSSQAKSKKVCMEVPESGTFCGVLPPAAMRLAATVAFSVGRRLADHLKERGASDILDAARLLNTMEAPNVAPKPKEALNCCKASGGEVSKPVDGEVSKPDL